MTYVDPVVAALTAERKRRRWTHEQLAKRARVGRSTISRFEAGRHSPTLVVVRAIATALGRNIALPEQQVIRE